MTNYVKNGSFPPCSWLFRINNYVFKVPIALLEYKQFSFIAPDTLPLRLFSSPISDSNYYGSVGQVDLYDDSETQEDSTDHTRDNRQKEGHRVKVFSLFVLSRPEGEV